MESRISSLMRVSHKFSSQTHKLNDGEARKWPKAAKQRNIDDQHCREEDKKRLVEAKQSDEEARQRRKEAEKRDEAARKRHGEARKHDEEDKKRDREVFCRNHLISGASVKG
jgi:hypothetical protein